MESLLHWPLLQLVAWDVRQAITMVAVTMETITATGMVVATSAWIV